MPRKQIPQETFRQSFTPRDGTRKSRSSIELEIFASKEEIGTLEMSEALCFGIGAAGIGGSRQWAEGRSRGSGVGGQTSAVSN